MLRNKYYWTNKKNQQGVTLLLAILILSAVMSISFSLTSILFIELRSSGDMLKTESSLYGATGVGEQALFHLKRASCPSNSPSCYYSQFENSVSMVGNPEAVTSNSPIFNDKVKAYSTFNTTSSIYEFCPTTSVYVGAVIQGCGYGKVTMNYINTGSNNNIYAYLCEWDPNATFDELPCSDTSSIIHTDWVWLNPCTTSCSGGPAQGTGTQNSDGSVLLNPGTSNTVTWDIDPNKQQQLIVVNLNTSADVYYSVATYDADNVTPKGLPYVGSTSINISTKSGQAGRNIRVTVPNAGLSDASSASGFSYYRTITVNPGQVTGGPLINFPVLVNFTDSSLRSTSNGGNVESSSGNDIAFTTDSSGIIVLPFELESYNPSTGNVVAWVNISSLDNGSTFYMFYGKPSASSMSNPNAVWDSAYKGVWHANDSVSGASFTVRNSTANSADMTATVTGGTPSSITGKVGPAQNYPNTNQYFGTRASTAAAIGIGTGNRTYSAWIRQNARTTTDAGYSGLFGSSLTPPYQPASDDEVAFSDSGSLHYHGTYNWSGYQTPNTSILSLNTWYYVVATYDGSFMRIYINGSLSQSLSASGLVFANQPFHINYIPAYGIRFNNIAWDELRASNVSRSSNWIATEYANQNDPNNFYSVGTEETP